MLPSTPQPPASSERLRVSIVSNDTGLKDMCSDVFEVDAQTMAGVLNAPEQMRCHVLIVDASDQQRLVPVARLAAEGAFAVVVIARQQDAVAAMKYLDVGAVDVIWFGSTDEEIRARIRSAARHVQESPDDWITVGDIAISQRRQQVRRRGEIIHLTPTEFRLLDVLTSARGKTVSHRDLMARVWGPELLSARHYLRVYVRQLREKLEQDAAVPTIILTEPGLGYSLAGVTEQRRQRDAAV